MMLTASIIGVGLTTLGNIVSIQLDTPPGATIVLIMGSVYALSLLGKWIYIKIRSITQGK